MDDFTVYENFFDDCLINLTRVLERCIEFDLVLNFEICHFFTSRGIVLGHIISEKGIMVDQVKIDVITNPSYPTNVKEVRYFLRHADFHCRFIKDFSKITQPLTNLLQKEVEFKFNEEYKQGFDKLNATLIGALVIQAPRQDLPFEIMCDTSNYTIGAVLGQRVEKKHHVIYYASKTLNPTQCNYTTTEKELLPLFLLLTNLDLM